MSDKPAIDTSLIDDAPNGDNLDPNSELEGLYIQLGERDAKIASLTAELARLAGSSDIESVKAKLLEPYVNKVFGFVAIYCGFVGVILFLAGMQIGFTLPETILAIISGSTAVSVIGLIGLVVTGLFGSKKS